MMVGLATSQVLPPLSSMVFSICSLEVRLNPGKLLRYASLSSKNGSRTGLPHLADRALLPLMICADHTQILF
jgi:hypothetical protein